MTILFALTLDLLLREPPDAAHPVVAMGRLLDRLGATLPCAPRCRARSRGALAWAAGLAVVTSVASAGDGALRRLPRPVATLGRAVALWTVLSLRLLLDEVDAVEAALQADDVALARRRLARIVSRDTATLTPSEIRQGAIESLVENTSDSVVAPLFWAAVGGLPAAVAYRYVNTADACWGYRDARWRHAGWAAARADDVANLLPARLTGVLLAGRAVALRTLRAEAAGTPSPNAGWPMAAAALACDIRLEKPGAYTLHPTGRQPTTRDLHHVRRRVLGTVAVVAAAAAVADARRRPWRR